jgi:hypothetical protein
LKYCRHHEIVKIAADNLETLENAIFIVTNQDVQSTFLRSDGPSYESIGQRADVDVGPHARSLTKEQIARLLTVGGEHCDGCEKTREELGLKRLNICKQCTRA